MYICSYTIPPEDFFCARLNLNLKRIFDHKHSNIIFPFSIFVYFLHFNLCDNLDMHARILSIEAWIYVSKQWIIPFHISFSNTTGATSREELLTLPEHQSLPPAFSGIHVAPCFVSMKCFVEHYLSFFFWTSVLPVLLRLMASPHVISLSFLTIFIFFNFFHFQPIVYFVTPRFAPNKHSGLCVKV